MAALLAFLRGVVGAAQRRVRGALNRAIVPATRHIALSHAGDGFHSVVFGGWNASSLRERGVGRGIVCFAWRACGGVWGLLSRLASSCL